MLKNDLRCIEQFVTNYSFPIDEKEPASSKCIKILGDETDLNETLEMLGNTKTSKDTTPKEELSDEEKFVDPAYIEPLLSIVRNTRSILVKELDLLDPTVKVFVAKYYPPFSEFYRSFQRETQEAEEYRTEAKADQMEYEPPITRAETPKVKSQHRLASGPQEAIREQQEVCAILKKRASMLNEEEKTQPIFNEITKRERLDQCLWFDQTMLRSLGLHQIVQLIETIFRDEKDKSKDPFKSFLKYLDELKWLNNDPKTKFIAHFIASHPEVEQEKDFWRNEDMMIWKYPLFLEEIKTTFRTLERCQQYLDKNNRIIPRKWWDPMSLGGTATDVKFALKLRGVPKDLQESPLWVKEHYPAYYAILHPREKQPEPCAKTTSNNYRKKSWREKP